MDHVDRVYMPTCTNMLPYDWLIKYLRELAVYTAKTVDSHIKYNQFSNPRESKAEASSCFKWSDVFFSPQ